MELLFILSVTWLAGLAATGGCWIAYVLGERTSVKYQEFAHGAVAFGGGLLVAAIAFALVPEGMVTLRPAVLTATFCLGGVVFCAVDAHLARRGDSRAQLLSMLMDYVPEALSLGAVFCRDRGLGLLLAVFIGAQNLPEGFNAFREVVAAGVKPRRALGLMVLLSLLGPAAACAGYLFLQDLPGLTAVIMSFAAGGILYLVFEDLAPDARMDNHWLPPLGAVLGFAMGMIGNQVLG